MLSIRLYLKLLRKIINYEKHSIKKRYDWILDPFLGSGTTVGVAQKMEGNSIGIEIVPEYVEMAKAKCSTL